MANRSTKKSLERFKYEVADELGVPLSNGYNGDPVSYTHLTLPTT